MYKIGEHEMVSCPYNRSHVVSKLRIQKHIIKCQDRHPEVKLITCFYNYTHKLKPENILKHYEICSQKIRMEEARYCENNGSACKSEVQSFCDSINNEKACLFSTKKKNSVKSYVSEDSKSKTSQNGSRNESFKDDDGDDLKPLSLPKTLSKAFTMVKPVTDKSSNSVPASESLSSPAGVLGRGKIFFFNPPKPRAEGHLQQDKNGMKDGCVKKVKSRPRYILNNVSDMDNRCDASVISTFDDGTTLKSDDFTLYDDDNEDNDGFIFKNFDKYVRI